MSLIIIYHWWFLKINFMSKFKIFKFYKLLMDDNTLFRALPEPNMNAKDILPKIKKRRGISLAERKRW